MALSALLIIGASCSKEDGIEKSPLMKKTTVDLPSHPDAVMNAVNGFTNQIHGILDDGDPYDGVSDESVEYGIWLMEAAFNAQHAVWITDYEDINKQELVEYEILVNLGAASNTLQGASMATKFIDALAYMEGQLGTDPSGFDEFFASIDFHLEEVTSTQARIKVVGLKALYSTMVNGPITTDDNWYHIGNIGKCDGSITTGDAAQRMSGEVIRLNYTRPGNIPANKLTFFTNINRERMGFAYGSGAGFIGSKTSTDYCQFVAGVNPILLNACNFPQFGHSQGEIPCMLYPNLIHYTNHMGQIVQAEKPNNKLYLGSICRGGNGNSSQWDANLSRSYVWHEFEVRYGVFIPISNDAPVDLRDLAMSF